MTKIEQGTLPEYDHHQLAGESNQETRGLNSRESEERCDPLPSESSRANEVTMEQVERCELGAIEGPSLGRQQIQTLLQRVSADMLSIDAENGALLATAAAAMQSRSAMADDCRAYLLVLHAELDEAYYDRPSDCAQRAAGSIYLVIDITEMELEQIESDALAALATIAERCAANAARAAQLQAHAAELLCRMTALHGPPTRDACGATGGEKANPSVNLENTSSDLKRLNQSSAREPLIIVCEELFALVDGREHMQRERDAAVARSHHPVRRVRWLAMPPLMTRLVHIVCERAEAERGLAQ